MSPFVGVLFVLFARFARGAVIELDDNSFYNYAKDRDVLLVDFYAPWCGDCKNLEPDFQAAARSLGSRSIDLAKVDCFGAGKGLCDSFKIKRWPTLKNFNRGKYTGDYTGGLSAAELSGYVNTVENSAGGSPVSNPYASPYQPMVIQTQQCVSRCKISKITNKAPCFAKCKTPKVAGRKMLPQPVINEKSCSKCRQPQIAGKFSRQHHCSRRMRAACRRRRHKLHRHTDMQQDTASKKATIGTLTAATNDNVLKLSLGEPLIIPPNAEHRRPRSDDLVTREPKFDKKGTAFDSGTDDALADADLGLSDRQHTLKLINDAQDKTQPVLKAPARDKYVQIPPHDSGDKKTKLKSEDHINYPLPKVPAKPFSPHKAPAKLAPKFASIKVPPHDSGDFHASPANKAFTPPGKPALLAVSHAAPNKLALAKRVKSGPLLPGGTMSGPLAPHVHPHNIERKSPPFATNKPIPDVVPLLPLGGTLHGPPDKKGAVKPVQQPLLVMTNGTGLMLNAPLIAPPKQQQQLPIVSNLVHMDQRIVAMNNVMTTGPKKLETMSPREALKVPYSADDKKSTILD